MKAKAIASSLALTAILAASLGAGSALAAGGGTFTMTLSGDPGNLDPQSSPSSSLLQISKFAYDSLLSMAPADGSIQPQLATDWSVDGTTVKLTLGDGITCSDGTPLTASDVVANLDYIANPDNQSPFLNLYYPAGATAVADDAAGTITITLAAPAPFVLNGLTDLPIVCAAGIADRSILASATSGTGPYVLSEAAPGDHYTFTVREGYTWGPDGATTDAEGLPDSVVVRIVENPSTAANLILTGDANAAIVTGPDAQRLAQEDLFVVDTAVLMGEMWFNHAEGRPASDPAVRQALTQAVDLAQLQQVLTAGQGSAPTTFATLAPVACPGDSVSPVLPAFDLAAAGQILDEAGWTVGDGGTRAKNGQPLSVTFLHDTSAGAAGQAAAELATQQWTALGATVVDKAQAGSATHGDALRDRRLGYRVDHAERQQPRPDRAVPVGTRPCGCRQQLLRDRQCRLRRRRPGGLRDAGQRGLPDLAGCRVQARVGGRCRALRELAREDLRQRRRVRHLRLAHPHQHPHGRELTPSGPARPRARRP